MTPKKAIKLVWFLCIIGGILMLFGTVSMVFFWIGTVMIFSSVVPHLLYYRCPHCGKHLGRSYGVYCPNCGKRIED